MMKKIFVTMFLLMGFVALSTNTVVAETNTITVTDGINDVLNDTYEEVSRPNVDIKTITCVQDGKQVELQLKLVETGTIQSSLLSSYTIALITTSNTYMIVYGFLSETSTDSTCIVADQNYEEIENEYSVSVDTLTVSFDLSGSTEKCIIVGGYTYEMSGLTDTAQTYQDIAGEEDENLIIDVGGPYTGEAGDSITFSGSLDEGNPLDYDWLWIFDDINLVLEGQSQTHLFDIPGEYSGTLYVYDSDGNYNYESFSASISDSSTNGGGQDKDGVIGSSWIIFVVIIAIVVVVGVAVVVYIIRR